MNRLKIKEHIAYYLPQFHQIKENDEWWGEGFTEWVKVKEAKQLSSDQETLYPFNDNYYDLSDIRVLENQYKLAKEHSITGFCMWHYWFGEGEMLLEKPAENIITSDIDVRFCFGWANHSWWNKTDNILLKEQKYPGYQDQAKHMDYLIKFFNDGRYMKVNGKPIFLIFKVFDIPNAKQFILNLRELAILKGMKGLYIVGEFCKESDIEKYGLDAVLNSRGMLKNRNFKEKVRDKLIVKGIINEKRFNPRKYSYRSLMKGFNSPETYNDGVLPVIIPRWDSTVRHGENGWYLFGSTPEVFKEHVSDVKSILERKKIEERIVFTKSWNEWAEGNFIEPDKKYECQYLKVIKDEFIV